MGGKLKWISSGDNIVVGVNSANHIYYRKGITAATPTGTGWERVTGGLVQIDVYNTDIWGVNTNDEIYQAALEVEEGDVIDPAGDSEDDSSTVVTGFSAWSEISGGLTRVSTGQFGVWGVNKNGNIYYR